MKRRVSQASLFIVSLSLSCGVSHSRQISLNFLSPKPLPLPPGPFLSFFACVSSSCVSAHPPMPGPALPLLLTHSNMPCSEHVPSDPRDADRAQTPLSKGPFTVAFLPLPLTWLQTHWATSYCLRAFTLLLGRCFPGFHASSSLVFALALLLPCSTVSEGHNKAGWGGGAGRGGDMDPVREDFFQVTWGSYVPSISNPQSSKL